MAEKMKERVLTYEIQILQAGRWEIHSRFPSDAKDAAIAEAEELENTGNNTVKVIKEVYNSDTNQSDEFTIYRTTQKKDLPGGDGGGGETEKTKKKPAKKKPAKKKPAKKDSAAPEAKHAEKLVDEALGKGKAPPPPKPPASILRVLFKLLMVVVVSGLAGFLMLMLSNFIMKNAGSFGYYVSGTNRANLAFAVFVITFLLSSIPMTLYVLSRENLNFEFKGPRRVGAANAGRQAAGRRGGKMSLSDREEAEKRVADVVAGKGKKNGDEEPEKKEEKKKPELPEPTKPPPALDAWGNKQKTLLMKFLDENLVNVGPTANLDNFNKFGVNLFLAGACEAMGTERELDVRATTHILSEAVQAMGFKRHQAQSFADKYQDYLLADQRYMKMFQAGRGSIEKVLEGEAVDDAAMQKALADWNKPKDEADTSQIVTVMFTDMVGSTAMTQILGDEGAQKVVRAHNAIVRQALSHHRGKEVKHTGDGIMASFANATDGVKAAIQILQQSLRHNKRTPEVPMRLKIGLHAGQAIAEDDDLFGTHVQLAARIVDKAGESEIYVSETAHGICAGSSLKFTSRGKLELKGFSEPQAVYLALWDGQEEATQIAEQFRQQAASALKKIKEEEARIKAEEEAKAAAEAAEAEGAEAQEGEGAEPAEAEALTDELGAAPAEQAATTEPPATTAPAATEAPAPAATAEPAPEATKTPEAPTQPPKAS